MSINGINNKIRINVFSSSHWWQFSFNAQLKTNYSHYVPEIRSHSIQFNYNLFEPVHQQMIVLLISFIINRKHVINNLVMNNEHYFIKAFHTSTIIVLFFNNINVVKKNKYRNIVLFMSK